MTERTAQIIGRKKEKRSSLSWVRGAVIINSEDNVKRVEELRRALKDSGLFTCSYSVAPDMETGEYKILENNEVMLTVMPPFENNELVEILEQRWGEIIERFRDVTDTIYPASPYEALNSG